MPNKLFIGNLSFNVADEGLNDFFASMNIPVESIRVMRDAETGRSRGFAFVEMSTRREAQKAVSMLNKKSFLEKEILVKEARVRRGFRGRG